MSQRFGIVQPASIWRSNGSGYKNSFCNLEHPKIKGNSGNMALTKLWQSRVEPDQSVNLGKEWRINCWFNSGQCRKPTSFLGILLLVNFLSGSIKYPSHKQRISLLMVINLDGQYYHGHGQTDSAPLRKVPVRQVTIGAISDATGRLRLSADGWILFGGLTETIGSESKCSAIKIILTKQ